MRHLLFLGDFLLNAENTKKVGHQKLRVSYFLPKSCKKWDNKCSECPTFFQNHTKSGTSDALTVLLFSKSRKKWDIGCSDCPTFFRNHTKSGTSDALTVPLFFLNNLIRRPSATSGTSGAFRRLHIFRD